MTAPLDGILVLDLTRVLSGPHAARMLCDLGADVIKIEPPAGDLTRFSSPRRHGMASYFAQQNTGKRNISIDLGRPEGAAVLLDLVERADVLLENYRPGVADRLGIGPDAALARNPRLVYASISGYGQTGPWVHRRAYAPVVEAETGIIASQGNARAGLPLHRGGPEHPDVDYRKDPHSHADVYTALEACSAVLAALFQREHTGRGQRVDISMAETMLYVNEHLHDALYDEEVAPGTIRSFQPHDYVVMRVANGESLVVSGHPAERGTFDFFMKAIGRPDLIDDPRFDDVASRLEHFDELLTLIEEFAAGVPDAETFEEICSHHQLAVGRVRQPAEITRTEWAAERGVIVDVDDRHGGMLKVPNAPWRFSDGPDVGVSGVPHYRGEDNRQVLGDVLGYDAERVDALESDGVLSHHFPPGFRPDA